MSENEVEVFYDVSDLATSEDLEVNGVWRDLPKGGKVKVARWQNTEFTRMMRTGYKANRDLIDGEDDLADKVGIELLIDVMASTILKDIKGVGHNGKRIEKLTVPIAKELLSVKDFREKIKALSENVDQYRIKAEDKAVKS